MQLGAALVRIQGHLQVDGNITARSLFVYLFLFFYLFTYFLIYLFQYLFVYYLFIYLFISVFIYLFVSVFIYLFIYCIAGDMLIGDNSLLPMITWFYYNFPGNGLSPSRCAASCKTYNVFLHSPSKCLPAFCFSLLILLFPLLSRFHSQRMCVVFSV